MVKEPSDSLVACMMCVSNDKWMWCPTIKNINIGVCNDQDMVDD